MLYISTSTYFKFRLVDINSIDKQGQVSQSVGQGLDITIINKNKQKQIIIDPTSDKDFSPID